MDSKCQVAMGLLDGDERSRLDDWRRNRGVSRAGRRQSLCTSIVQRDLEHQPQQHQRAQKVRLKYRWDLAAPPTNEMQSAPAGWRGFGIERGSIQLHSG